MIVCNYLRTWISKHWLRVSFTNYRQLFIIMSVLIILRLEINCFILCLFKISNHYPQNEIQHLIILPLLLHSIGIV